MALPGLKARNPPAHIKHHHPRGRGDRTTSASFAKAHPSLCSSLLGFPLEGKATFEQESFLQSSPGSHQAQRQLQSSVLAQRCGLLFIARIRSGSQRLPSHPRLLTCQHLPGTSLRALSTPHSIVGTRLAFAHSMPLRHTSEAGIRASRLKHSWWPRVTGSPPAPTWHWRHRWQSYPIQHWVCQSHPTPGRAQVMPGTHMEQEEAQHGRPVSVSH